MRLWYQTSQTLGKLNIYDFRTIFIINLGYFRIKASEFLGYFMTSFLTLEHFTTFQKQKNKNVISLKLFLKTNINIVNKTIKQLNNEWNRTHDQVKRILTQFCFFFSPISTFPRVIPAFSSCQFLFYFMLFSTLFVYLFYKGDISWARHLQWLIHLQQLNHL